MYIKCREYINITINFKSGGGIIILKINFANFLGVYMLSDLLEICALKGVRSSLDIYGAVLVEIYSFSNLIVYHWLSSALINFDSLILCLSLTLTINF